MQLDGPSYNQSTVPRRASMVEKSLVAVERPIFPTTVNGSRHLHGFIRQPLGISHQRDSQEGILDNRRSKDAHQLEGINVHLDSSQPSTGSWKDSQYYLRQPVSHSIHQQIWR